MKVKRFALWTGLVGPSASIDRGEDKRTYTPTPASAQRLAAEAYRLVTREKTFELWPWSTGPIGWTAYIIEEE